LTAAETSNPLSAQGWHVAPHRIRIWGSESVVLNQSTGDTHLISGEAGHLLQQMAHGHGAVPLVESLHDPLAELLRLGLIRRDTPVA
jgi:hypothetical protein